jgi:general secretion pathway protein A
MLCHEDDGEESKLREGDQSRVVVESRHRVLARLREAVLAGANGPILITGEAGSGKTWVSRRLVAGLPASWRSSYVPLTAPLDPLDFLTLAGNNLGLAVTNRYSALRLGLQAVLEDERADGRSWLLIIDDAHRAAPELWDEIQVLADQVGRRGGFAALLILSDTELIRTSTTRRFRSFAVSLCDHHHLEPLDLDEARELLGLSADVDEKASFILEQVHRDSAGNPQRLLRLADSRLAMISRRMGGINASNLKPSLAGGDSASGMSIVATRRDHAATDWATHTPKLIDRNPRPGGSSMIGSEPPIGIDTPAPSAPAAEPPALIPTKPPIRIEEGLVEVGWEGDLEAEYIGPEEPIITSPEPTDRRTTTVRETVVEDHYAALQAWAEQSSNRLRARSDALLPGDELAAAAVEPAEMRIPATADALEDSELEQAHTSAKIRAEGQHEFAPYSQLFTRLRHQSS